MIVMINGAFGIGKTTVANHLESILENSMIYDPEEVGTLVRQITAKVRNGTEDTNDYQDIELWRTLTIQVGDALYKKYKRHLIIPMTLANIDYFRGIKQGLAQIDADLHHFCLMGSTQTIHARLKKRGHELGSWPFEQTKRCLEAFKSPEFEVKIDTENKTPEDIAVFIHSYLGTT
jgi:deoxyadenosine/deoxycytidine kinase